MRSLWSAALYTQYQQSDACDGRPASNSECYDTYLPSKWRFTLTLCPHTPRRCAPCKPGPAADAFHDRAARAIAMHAVAARCGASTPMRRSAASITPQELQIAIDRTLPAQGCSSFAPKVASSPLTLLYHRNGPLPAADAGASTPMPLVVTPSHPCAAALAFHAQALVRCRSRRCRHCQ